MARTPATPAARRTSRRHIDKRRCRWARGTDPDYIRYHDQEWGRPVHEDRRLFEMLTLEGAQAGLSWSTILRKRAGYRRAFANFDPRKVARFDARRRAQLRRDAGIVRNRLKIDATVSNAQAFLRPLPVVIRVRQAPREPPARRAPGVHALERRPLPGPREARFSLRRHHHRVRLPAGGRRSERPFAGVLPVPAAGPLPARARRCTVEVALPPGRLLR